MNELALLYRYWGIENFQVVDRAKLNLSKNWYLKAIKNKKENIQSYDGLGRVLSFLGEYDEAEKWLLTGLKIKKWDFRLQMQLVDLMVFKVRNKGKAEQYLKQLAANRSFADKRGYIENRKSRIIRIVE